MGKIVIVGVLVLVCLAHVADAAPAKKAKHAIHNRHNHLMDLEKKVSSVKASWSPYDPAINNREALVNRAHEAMPGVITDDMDPETRRAQLRLQREFLKDQKDQDMFGVNEDSDDLDLGVERNIKRGTKALLEQDKVREKYMMGTVSHNVERDELSCLHLLEVRIADAPTVTPESWRSSKNVQFMDRTNQFVLDTILGDGYRPVYVKGQGLYRHGAKRSMEEMFDLLDRDHRPLLTKVSITVGSDFAISWIIQSVNNNWMMFQAGPKEQYSLMDWLAPEKWQRSMMESKDPESVSIPRPTNDFLAAKFGFGGGQTIHGSRAIAYRNNLRQVLAGLCSSKPPAQFYYSVSALFGSTKGYGHSGLCNFSYDTYEYNPSSCSSRAVSSYDPTLATSTQYPEYGFVQD
jgi:hypothetical protein